MHLHRFLGLDEDGFIGITVSPGKLEGHIILGGGRQPNYDATNVRQACAQLSRAGLAPHLVVGASHAKSVKDPARQAAVIVDLAARIGARERALAGVMIESNLCAGRQELRPGAVLTSRQSITDACIGWEETAALLAELATAIRQRRRALQQG